MGTEGGRGLNISNFFAALKSVFRAMIAIEHNSVPISDRHTVLNECLATTGIVVYLVLQPVQWTVYLLCTVWFQQGCLTRLPHALHPTLPMWTFPLLIPTSLITAATRGHHPTIVNMLLFTVNLYDVFFFRGERARPKPTVITQLV